eukprot:1348468-Amphidinium_carterae.1
MDDASSIRSGDFAAGYQAGVEAARLEEEEGPEPHQTQGSGLSEESLPLYYSSPQGEVRVSPPAS